MRRRSVALLAVLLLAPLLASLVAPAARAAEITVFAAASLTDVLREIGTLWQQQGHVAPRMSFASSSTLARQIAQGAPANIFASADERWMDDLVSKGLIAADTRIDLLGNDLVLIVPRDRATKVTIAPGFDLAALLGPGGRLATGDPAHVPVGLYAKQALTHLGLWDIAEPRLARTEDVRGALVLVERGEAPAGIVYATDAAASQRVAIAGVFPADSHDPVTYPFAVVKPGDTPDARAFLAFIEGPEAASVFKAHGFRTK